MKNAGGSAEDYVYDANGNITTSIPKGLDPIVYDPFTQMTKNLTITGTPTHTVNFQYTADNERILKNEKLERSGNLGLDGQGVTNKSYVYIRGNNDYPVTEKANLNNSLSDRIYIYGPTGLIAFKDATATYFVIEDHLGSIRVVVNETGDIVSYTDYDPWGMILNGRSTDGSYLNAKYKFTGKELDTETGYFHFGARPYNGRIGRWMLVDLMFEIYP